jgi:hypothetical protein
MSEYIEQDGWQLRDRQTNEQIKVSHMYLFPENDGAKKKQFEILGGAPPHKPSSTGRVYGKWHNNNSDREYFPTVFNLQWFKT